MNGFVLDFVVGEWLSVVEDEWENADSMVSMWREMASVDQQR